MDEENPYADLTVEEAKRLHAQRQCEINNPKPPLGHTVGAYGIRPATKRAWLWENVFEPIGEFLVGLIVIFVFGLFGTAGMLYLLVLVIGWGFDWRAPSV